VFLTRFIEQFDRIGYTGEDLLDTPEIELLNELGISFQHHTNRFSSKLSKLKDYNNRQITEKRYYDLEKEYKKAKADYHRPARIVNWKTFDVFAFIKSSNTPALYKFLKPVALTELNGEQLLLLSQHETQVFFLITWS
jgi:hypothetical protein